jgi:hypothetical protein
MLLVLALIVFMGWLQFSSGSDDSNAHLTASVDKDPAQKDKDKAVDKVGTTAQKTQE